MTDLTPYERLNQEITEDRIEHQKYFQTPFPVTHKMQAILVQLMREGEMSLRGATVIYEVLLQDRDNV